MRTVIYDMQQLLKHVAAFQLILQVEKSEKLKAKETRAMGGRTRRPLVSTSGKGNQYK